MDTETFLWHHESLGHRMSVKGKEGRRTIVCECGGYHSEAHYELRKAGLELRKHLEDALMPLVDWLARKFPARR